MPYDRRDLQSAHECRAYLFFAGIAARFGDHFDAIVRLLQAPASGIQAYCIDRLGRCPAALACVLPGEVAGTHVNVLGQAFYRQIGIQILRHPAVKVGEDVRIGLGLSCKQRVPARLR